MAGRSGAATIEVALREAAQNFNAKQLADLVRKSSDPDASEALAAALEAAALQKPRLERREGEVWLEFASPKDSARRMDCSSLLSSVGYGVEVLYDPDERVFYGVSFYLE